MPDLATDALIEDGRVVLHPPPHRDMIHRETTLRHNVFQITVAKRVPKIPSHARHNDLVLKVSPSEQRRSVSSHSFTLPDPLRAFATHPTR